MKSRVTPLREDWGVLVETGLAYFNSLLKMSADCRTLQHNLVFSDPVTRSLWGDPGKVGQQ